MAPSLGVNLRATGQLDRGDRKYMEDFFSVAYQQTDDEKDLEYAFFGIFDGHGGREAAVFAKEHLMDFIVNDKRFWSDDDDDVLQAISNGYIQTHYAMWKDQVNWPKTSSGLPSTSGTTASIAFIRKGKIYIGHVGDSSIVLGYQIEGEKQWRAKALTRDHKPEDANEVARIRKSGGKVVRKSGVPRVVWNRPRLGHKGPVRRSTPIDEIPFLAVARSLGDLWSYNSDSNQFVVSPQPDVQVIKIDVETHRCLIFGTDGLWNMLNPSEGVHIVQFAERHNEKHVHGANQPANSKNEMWINPSRSLVSHALQRWCDHGSRADNTSAVTLMLDPPGPPRRTVLLQRVQVTEHPNVGTANDIESEANLSKNDGLTASKEEKAVSAADTPKQNSNPPSDVEENSNPSTSKGGVAIFTRLPASPPLGNTFIEHPPLSSSEDASCSSQIQSSTPSKDLGQCKVVVTPLSSDLVTMLQHEQPVIPKHSKEPRSENVLQSLDSADQSTVQSHVDLSDVKPPMSLENQVISKSVDKAADSSEQSLSALPLFSAPVKDFSPGNVHPCNVKEVSRREGGNQPVQLPANQTEPNLKNLFSESSLRHSHKRLRGPSGKHVHDLSSIRQDLLKNSVTGDKGVRRRHSSVLDVRSTAKSLSSGYIRRSLGYSSPFDECYQPGSKRRTRSEDKLLQPGRRLEDDTRTSDEENERVTWPVSWMEKLRSADEGSEENNRSCAPHRRKKWLRLSGNSLGRMKQSRTSGGFRQSTNFISASVLSNSRDCSEEENNSRVLRSDTLAAMPVRTLRSRNVDIKAPRLSLHTPTKLTAKRSSQLKASLEIASSPASSSLLPSTKLTIASALGSTLSKRHRQTHCGRTRSMTTRSRVKRLNK